MRNEDVRDLVRLYEERRCLWDSKEKNFFDKKVRDEVWRDIAAQMDMSVKVLKDKMTSLMGSYRREKSREKRSDTYKSKWFAFDWFNFLLDRNNPRLTMNQGETSTDEIYVTRHNTDADDDQKEEMGIKKRGSRGKAQKRRGNHTSELQEVREELTNALNRIDNILKDQIKSVETEEDEFDLYAKLLAKKLRKFTQRECQEIMYEIDGLVLSRIYNHSEPISRSRDSVSSPPPSSQTIIITKRSPSPCSPYTSPLPSP